MVVRSRASDNDRTERSGHDTISPGGVIFDAVVVVTGHGYEFTLDGTSIAMFDALLKTVTLSPSDAIDLPPMT